MEDNENRKFDRVGQSFETHLGSLGQAASSATIPEQIAQLDDLRQKGILTDAEFEDEEGRTSRAGSKGKFIPTQPIIRTGSSSPAPYDHHMASPDPTSSPPATQFSISISVTLDNRPGVLGALATAIGDAGGSIYAIDGFVAKGPELDREIVVNCRSVAHQYEVVSGGRSRTGGGAARLARPHVPNARRWKDRGASALSGRAIETISPWPTPQGSLACAWRSPTMSPWPTSTRSGRTRWRSSAMARPSWDSATSGRRRRCR